MKNSSHKLCPPGAIFLRTACVLYADHAVSGVFQSAIADFQNELREAGSNRLAHLVVRCRWYWALLALLVATPFYVSKSLRADQVALTRTIASGWLFVGLYALPFAGPWSCFREFMIAASAGGSVLACAMRAWNDRRSSHGIVSPHISWDSATAHSEAPVLTAKFLDHSVTPARFG
jgi:hypothetical protein